MKKSLKLVISLVLCLAMVISFASCNIIGINQSKHPSGYTGGFNPNPKFHVGLEIYWVETYEEAMEAIEHLEAYDNKIGQCIMSSYENEAVDAKYCFKLYKGNTKKRKKGQKWYDHKYSQVTVSYYGFLDNVTIEEIEYSMIGRYKYFSFDIYDRKLNGSKPLEISHTCETQEFFNGERKVNCLIIDTERNCSVAELYYMNINDHWEELPVDFHEKFIKSIVPIGG